MLKYNRYDRLDLYQGAGDIPGPAYAPPVG